MPLTGVSILVRILLIVCFFFDYDYEHAHEHENNRTIAEFTLARLPKSKCSTKVGCL
jgi:hypothetical protein